MNPDETATGEGSESPPDKRYFYHQDRNWNVIALSEYVPSGGSGVNGRIVERYTYTPYGEFIVLKGDSGSGELGSASPTSPVGNVFFHQGLPLDQEKQSYQNRHREYAPPTQRFAQRDPLGAPHGFNAYVHTRAAPTAWIDPRGLVATCMLPGCLETTEQGDDAPSGCRVDIAIDPPHCLGGWCHTAVIITDGNGTTHRTEVTTMPGDDDCCDEYMIVANSPEGFRPGESRSGNGRTYPQSVCDCLKAASQQFPSGSICYHQIWGPNCNSYTGCILRACGVGWEGATPWGWDDFWDHGDGEICKDMAHLPAG